jgi:hypothetical protein
VQPSTVLCVAAAPDGGIIASGAFTSADGAPLGPIARRDPVTGVWSGLHDPQTTVTAVPGFVVLADGTIVAVGGFTIGSSSFRLAYFDPRSSRWTGVDVESVDPGWGSITAIAARQDGSVVVARLRSDGAENVSRLIRFRAHPFRLERLPGEYRGVVRAMVDHPTGLFVGGDSVYTPDGPSPGLVRLDEGIGQLVPAVAGVNVASSGLARSPDGRIAVVGAMTTRADYRVDQIAGLLDPVSGRWDELIRLTSDDVPIARQIGVLPDGQVVIGGWFSAINGKVVNSIALVDPVSKRVSTLGQARGGVPPAVLPAPAASLRDGEFIVGAPILPMPPEGSGQTPLPAVNRVYSAARHAFTAAYQRVRFTNPGRVGARLVSLPGTGGRTLAAGGFAGVEGLAAPYLAVFNPGTGWAAIPGAVDGPVLLAMPLRSGDALLVHVPRAGFDQRVQQLSRLSMVTGAVTRLGAPLLVSSGNTPVCIELPDGRVLVSGDLGNSWGTGSSNIFVIDPVSGRRESVGTVGLRGGATAAALGPAGLGGRVLLAERVANDVTRVVELDMQSGRLTPVAPPPGGNIRGGAVWTLLWAEDGSIFAGGGFNRIDDRPVSSLARFDAASSRWEELAGGVNGGVSLLAMPASAGGDLLVLGGFTAAGGERGNGATLAPGLARYRFSVCPGDVDCDRASTISDVTVFLSWWYQRDARADVDASGVVGIDDVLVFLARWFAPG